MASPVSLETLVTLGLTPSEARLYLAAVQAPGSRVTDLAEHADVPRSRAYRLLARLEERGLVHPRPGVSRRYEAIRPTTAVRQLAAERHANLEARTQRALAATGTREDPGSTAQEQTALVNAITTAAESVLLALAGPAPTLLPASALTPPRKNVRVRVLTATNATHPALAWPDAEIRFRPHLAASWVVVDQELVFYHSPHLLGSDDEPPVVSRSRTFAAALTDAFETAWSLADPRNPASGL